MGAYNKGRRERDFREGEQERKYAAEEAQRAGWVSHFNENYELLVWTHPEHLDRRYLGSAINIPERYRRS